MNNNYMPIIIAFKIKLIFLYAKCSKIQDTGKQLQAFVGICKFEKFNSISNLILGIINLQYLACVKIMHKKLPRYWVGDALRNNATLSGLNRGKHCTSK